VDNYKHLYSTHLPIKVYTIDEGLQEVGFFNWNGFLERAWDFCCLRYNNCMNHKEKQLYLLGFILIAVLCFSVYSYSLKGGFLWDDQTLILSNSDICSNSFSGVFLKPVSERFSGYYRPLQIASYKIDYLIWQFNPFGFHLTNIFIHLVNSFLFYAIVFGLSSSLAAAFFAGLIFSIHPLFSEPVNYISSRSDLLLGLFLLLSFMFYIKIRGNMLKNIYFYFSIAFFIAAVFTKESALVFPLFLMAYEILLEKEGRKNLLFYFLIPLSYILARLFLQSAQHPMHQFHMVPLLLTDLKIMTCYAGLVFFPFGLHKNWLLPLTHSIADSQFILSFFAVMGAMIFTWRIAKENKLFVFGMLWFLIFIIPVLNSVLLPLLNLPPSSGVVILSEAWVYLAAGGMILALSSFLVKPLLKGKKIFLWLVLFGSICFYAFLTIGYNKIWSGNSADFYKYQLRYHPFNAEIHYNLANIYSDQDLYNFALDEYSIVLSLNSRHAYARNNIANLYLKMGDFDRSIIECKKAIELDPLLFKAYYNLGRAYFGKREYANSIKAFKYTLMLKPDFKEAKEGLEVVENIYNLGISVKGRKDR
jgi:hypothetical protein